MSDLPQLRMRHFLVDLPAAPTLPDGFTLREAKEEDSEGIANVLRAAFDVDWTGESVRKELLDHPEVPRTFVIETDGQIAATASYQIQATVEAEAGWVHWVGVHPRARGHGLGFAATHRVLDEAHAQGDNSVLLTTDDFRLPAIRVYLALGFKPDPWHPSHSERWTRVRAALEREGVR